MEPNNSSNLLETPIQYIKGVGPRRAHVLESLNIYTIKDLLYYFPRKYLDRTSIQLIGSIEADMEVNIVGRVKSVNLRKMKRGSFLTATLADHTGSVRLMWFNGSDYIYQSLKAGDLIAVHGKVADYKGNTQIVHPEYDKLNANEISLSTGFVIPVYPLTEDLKKSGLDNRNLRKIIYLALDSLSEIEDHFNTKQQEDFKICSLDSALRNIHFTNSIDKLDESIHRLKFDEHFFLQLILALKKSSLKRNKTKKFNGEDNFVKKIFNEIPFKLTDSQIRVLKDIRDDLESDKSMNRLIQGDVGCGKTIVALLAAAIAVDNTSQVAIMAPTEILAKQHFNLAKKIFNSDINVSLISGKSDYKEKINTYKKLSDHKIDIIFGTHAIFQKKVMFKKLGLIIIDEQHKFGVNQRKKLSDKGGDDCDVLLMSATPIPRTLTMTIYGDMDISIIREKPKNRKPIKTYSKLEANIDDVLKYIKKEIQ